MPLLPSIRTWPEWGAMFTDVEQWKSAVQEIGRLAGLPFRQIEAGYPGTNAVFVLDRAYVLKIYAPFSHEDFELERELYRVLGQNPALLVPRLIAEGVLEDQIRWPYIVMDYKPGRPIREVRSQLSRANLNEIAAQLGEMVWQMHQTPLKQLTSLDRSRSGWQAFLEARLRGCAAENRREGLLSEAVLDRVPDLLACMMEQPAPPLMLVNGDLTEDHLLLDQREGWWHISGLIDFADAMVGQREYEWIALWFSALEQDGECLRAFIKSYDPEIRLDGAFLRSVTAFTFLHEFGAGIISMVLKRAGYPPVRSMGELQEVLWGGV